MPKRPISLTTHARLDFASALLMLVLPLALRLHGPARPACWLLGGSGLVIGSCTRYAYPLRLWRVLGPLAHRRAEALSIPVYLLALWADRGRVPRACLLGQLAALLLLRALTDWPED